MKTLASEWTDFSRASLDPIKASEGQRQNARRIFYAGAAAMFGLMMRVSADDISEDQGEQLLSSLSAEIDRYVEDLQHGRA